MALPRSLMQIAHPQHTSRRWLASSRSLTLTGRTCTSSQQRSPRSPFRSLSRMTLPSFKEFKYQKSLSPSCVASSSRRLYHSSPVWSALQQHPLDPLEADEISLVSQQIQSFFEDSSETAASIRRFIAISLKEPTKAALTASIPPPRQAEAVVLDSSGYCHELVVDIDSKSILEHQRQPRGVQPMFTPAELDLAEEIVQNHPDVQDALKERYGITDMKRVACDPWGLHFSTDEERTKFLGDVSTTTEASSTNVGRLVQTWLYYRQDGEGYEDNHYAHPIDLLPVIDLNTGELIEIGNLDRNPVPEIPKASVNYHRNLVSNNSYMENTWRSERLAALDIVQEDGPSFDVEGNHVSWQKWDFRVGFNYREGLVMHNLQYDGRPVVNRASLVEMAVPYADPHPPHPRKCAFDVGDYGLGYCSNSLELGCDCLGHIHYFDAVLSDDDGNPVTKPKAICMHEEDTGILWKHVEYRNGHNESRRSRELVISFIATVVNYEYLFYWRLKQDGTIHFDIKLGGELSTNLLSPAEEATGKPTHGTLVAPGVNAQFHQHMFCARLDMGVDGVKNTVSELDLVSQPMHPETNPFGNTFDLEETILQREGSDGVRRGDPSKARSWKISNAEGKLNPITGKPTSYKLLPHTSGVAQPTLLTSPEGTVAKKGGFAQAHLWVTPNNEMERYPAGEYTPQGDGSSGLPDWVAQNRNIEGEDVVLWHVFGVAHVPRVEDFPVMPCEITGFALKPDGFFLGNPAIDLPPEVNDASKLAKGSCCLSQAKE